MAIYAAGSTASDIRGSIAGTTYSRNKGGLYMRGRVAPINRRTTAQTLVRANFGANSKAWAGLTSDQRTAWTMFAAANPLVNVLGASIIVSGIAMFQKLNQVLKQIDAATISDPPSDLSVPALAAVTGLAVDSTAVTFTVNTLTQAVVSGAKYYFFATPPLSPGRTPQTSQFRFIGAAVASVGASSIDMTANWQEVFGAILEGKVYGLAASTVNSLSGAVTPALRFSTIST